MVLPEYRGLHYGFLLMEASKGYVKGNPYLYVKMFNWKAIKLYLMEGYKIVGIRKKSWKMEKGND
jgi:ribosomal protein S18 acetylase RimI-like enzyme